jgi:hypothetical protein
MSQATVVVGALLAMFAIYLIANGRAPAYLSVVGL